MYQDISCSKWGPYSVLGGGLSHILPEGHKVTCIPLCGYMSSYRPYPQLKQIRKDFEILEALPDLSFYKFRILLEPDKSVFADIEFFTISDAAACLEVTYHNKGTEEKIFETGLIFCFEENQKKTPAIEIHDGYILSACNYKKIDTQQAIWSKDHPFGCISDYDAYQGRTFSFSNYRGNEIEWNLNNEKSFNYLRLRYSSFGNEPINANVRYAGKSHLVTFMPTNGEYQFSEALAINKHDDIDTINLKLIQHSSELKIDCLVFSITKALPEVRSTSADKKLSKLFFEPEIQMASFLVNGAARRYGLLSSSLAEVTDFFPSRQYYGSNDEEIEKVATLYNLANMDNLKRNLQESEFRHIVLGGKYTNLKPNQIERQSFIIASGKDLHEFHSNAENAQNKVQETVTAKRAEYQQYRQKFTHGEYGNFAERLAAQCCININYPEVLNGKLVRHYSPAKHYNCFYSWDAGMTGLGMSNISALHSEEMLNQYLTSGQTNVPFLLWGTVLPIQIYQYWHSFQLSGDQAFLEKYFARAVEMYKFFSGANKNSQVIDRKLDLACNFHYFYNSGGWDDYPAQQEFHRIAKAGEIFPVVCLAQTILAAKVLRLAAFILHKNDFIESFSNDIERFEYSMHKYHWNEKEQLFSYYDKRDDSFLKINGEEANKGMDGYYPLVSSSVDNETAGKFRDVLFDHQHLYTDFGITTVDKTANYFREDGYWNGRVWPAHNWFFWKALLDYGFDEHAMQLADDILKAFNQELVKTHCITECLHHRLGKAAHVPYFSGLSAPLLDIYNAYYGTEGTVTTGFQVISCLTANGDNYKLTLQSPFKKGECSIILRLKPNIEYIISGSSETVFGKRLKTNKHGVTILKIELQEVSQKYLLQPINQRVY